MSATSGHVGGSCSHPHHHHHHHGPSAASAASLKNISIAFFLNLTFAVVELIGGWWTNSIAIQADAIHDFGDSLALAAALAFQFWASSHARGRFTFGFKRLSLLSAFFVSLVLLGGSAFIIVRALERFLNPVSPHLDGMFLLAILGVAVNGYAAWRIGRGKTQNERALSWHMIEDLLGWVAVLIGSIAMRFVDAPWLDPLLSLIIAGIVLSGAARNLWTSSQLFLQAAPNLDLDAMKQALMAIPKIGGVDSFKVWSLDGAHHVASLHIFISPELDAAERGRLKGAIRDVFAHFGEFEVTIEWNEPGH